MLEKASTMVVTKGRACIVGTEKLMKGILFLLVELLQPLIKLQIQITTVICCLGNSLVELIYFLVFVSQCMVMSFLNEKDSKSL